MSCSPLPGWVIARRAVSWAVVAFLFLCTYPTLAEAIPGAYALAERAIAAQQAAVTWLAGAVPGVAITDYPGGSGDTTYNWIEVGVFALVAALAGAVAAGCDRGTGPRVRRRYLAEAYLRFALAAAMLLYGFAKVFPSQFAPVTLDRLVTPYGDSSPMGLLWMFMRASRPYQVFGGALEVAAGLLLLSRRTTTLGALLTAAIMANVVAMNLCYDVGVKLFSAELLLAACVLAAPDAGRLARFLVLRREAALTPQAEPFASARGRRLRIGAEAALGATMVVMSVLATAFEDEAMVASLLPPAEMVGIHAVEIVEPAEPPEPRWLRLTIGEMGTASLMTDDLRAHFLTARRGDGGTTVALTLVDARPPRRFVLARDGEGDGLLLEEPGADPPFVARLRRLPTPDFLLTSRGFHLVNERPFHR